MRIRLEVEDDSLNTWTCRNRERNAKKREKKQTEERGDNTDDDDEKTRWNKKKLDFFFM